MSPVTHKQPAPDPLLLEPKTLTKRPLNEIPSMFLAHLLSVAVMVLDKRVLKEGDILCELYADTCSDVSDDSESEFLDSDIDSDVPKASSHKQFQPRTVVLTSDSDTNTEEEENSEGVSSDVWRETDKKTKQWSFSWNLRCEYSN